MSEIKLILIDSQQILFGTIHASVGDRCVAALSAEPETLGELQAALERYERTENPLKNLGAASSLSDVDLQPHGAGILIIDLAARIIVCDSTYSEPEPEGLVHYHDGAHETDVAISYQLPEDWLFRTSVEEFAGRREASIDYRAAHPPLDARPILYGYPLLAFIARNVRHAPVEETPCTEETNFDDRNPLSQWITAIHSEWLMTPRTDLRNQSPREVIMAKMDFINFDLQSRAMQWSFQLEGPPCLSRNSFAYRFAGFGSHEWIVYYDLVRYLLRTAVNLTKVASGQALIKKAEAPDDLESFIKLLEALKTSWLDEPCEQLDGHIPSLIIENERRRLPEAMGGRSMVVDEDCPICKQMGDESEAGLGVWFWHLDGSNMDDLFAFSRFRTEDDYLEDKLEMELRHRAFDLRWKEYERQLARGEVPSPDPFFDPIDLDELMYSPLRLEPEIPES